MPRSAALLGISVSLATVACGTTIHPGLANALALGKGPPVDTSVHDVVANGNDSCERGFGPGPLRYQIPPCPGVERPAAAATVVGRVQGANGVVMPWVEHYYSRWSCPFLQSREDAAIAVGFVPRQAAASDGRSTALTCALPP